MASLKIAAMSVHRTQMSPDAWFFVLAERIGPDFGMEHYQLLRADGTVLEGLAAWSLGSGPGPRRHGLKNRSLKRRLSHGRRPHASIPPRSSARPSGIRP